MKFRTKRVLLLQNTSVVTLKTTSFKHNLFVVGGRERIHIVDKQDGFRTLPRTSDLPDRPNTTTDTTSLHLQDDQAIPLIRSLKGCSKELYPRLARQLQTNPRSKSRSRHLQGHIHFLHPQIKRRTLNPGIFPINPLPSYDVSHRSSSFQDLV